MDLLKELHRGGATIVMVTHDPRYEEYSDRSIHLFDGQVVEDVSGPRAAGMVAELEEHGFDLG
jgi:putative ABC transport system ATP-binding protein